MTLQFGKLRAGVVAGVAALVLAVTCSARAADDKPPVTTIKEITEAIPADLFPPKDKPLTFAILKPMNAWLEANYQGKGRLGRFIVRPTERFKIGKTAGAREVSQATREGFTIVQHVQVGMPLDRAAELQAKEFVAEGAYRVDANTVTGKDKIKRLLLIVTLREPQILPAEK